MWQFQFVSLQYALIVSIDYRCADGHLIHDKTLTFSFDARDDMIVRIEKSAGREAALAYAATQH